MSHSSNGITEPSTKTGQAVAQPVKPVAINPQLLHAMQVTIEAHLGCSEMSVEELMALKSGSVVTLDTGLSEQLDLYLNGTLVARGTIVAVGEKFGIRITEVGSTS